MIFSKLRKNGILGMNRRVGEFILPYNPREKYPLVDNKVFSHQKALEFQLPSPELYFVVGSFGDLKNLKSWLRELNTFAVKPAHGAMGNGVLIVDGVRWLENGEPLIMNSRQAEMSADEFSYYLSGILSGLYSLNGQNDQVIFQEKLKIHPVFLPFMASGIPDVRVICFRGFPAMAMLRLPTKLSRGRANLHQGGVGCGIDLGTGRITYGVSQNRVIDHHPDSGKKLSELLLPHWQEILLLAARCYEAADMGYLGVDIVLDPAKGPLLLEINARPGLAIQTANLEGLVPRLETIKLAPPNMKPEDRVAFSIEAFSI